MKSFSFLSIPILSLFLLLCGCERDEVFFVPYIRSWEVPTCVKNTTNHKVEVVMDVEFIDDEPRFTRRHFLSPKGKYYLTSDEYSRFFFEYGRFSQGVDAVCFIFDNKYKLYHKATYRLDQQTLDRSFSPEQKNFFLYRENYFDTISPWIDTVYARNRQSETIFLITEDDYQQAVQASQSSH